MSYVPSSWTKSRHPWNRVSSTSPVVIVPLSICVPAGAARGSALHFILRDGACRSMETG